MEQQVAQPSKQVAQARQMVARHAKQHGAAFLPL